MSKMNNDRELRKQLYQQMITLDLTARYEELVRVLCTHEYFRAKALGGVSIIPTEQTKNDMKRLQLLYRQDPAGFSIGYALKPEFVAVELIDKPVRLTFWMMLTDNYFYNYTDIPYEPNRPLIYHFTNRDDQKLVADGDNYLTVDKFVSEADRIPIGSSAFVYEFEEVLFGPTEITVENDAGEVFFKGEADAYDLNIAIDMGQVVPGRYFLKVGEEIKRSWFVYPSDLRKLFGVIDIYIDKQDRSSYSLFLPNGRVRNKQLYNLHFASRKVYWKYVIMEGAVPNIHTEHKIVDTTRRGRNAASTGPMAFQEPEWVEQGTGYQALIICSQQPISLKQQHEEQLKLKTKKGKARMDWLTDLPCPTAKSTFKTDEKSGEIFSEIVVFL